jgi:hypothetical protein
LVQTPTLEILERIKKEKREKIDKCVVEELLERFQEIASGQERFHVYEQTIILDKTVIKQERQRATSPK